MPFDGGKSGISRYIERTLDLLSQEAEVDLIMMRKDHDLIIHRLSGSYNWLQIGRANYWSKPLLNIIFHCFIIPIYCLFSRSDYVFFPAGNRRFPIWISKKSVTMVHDFSHLHIPGKYDFMRHLYVTKVLPFFLKRASLIFTPSQSTKNDLVNLCGIDDSLVRVNLLGYSLPNLKIAKNPCEDFSILYVSRVEHPGKNHLGLIKAYEKLCEIKKTNIPLVLVGGDWSGSEEVHSYHQSSKYRDQVHFMGHLSEEKLEYEYGRASLFIYPSFYEGFGLPLLEAMSRGIPVISSDRGSLLEVGGAAALFADPEKPQEMAEKMKEMLDSSDLRQKYIQMGYENLKRFSWQAHTQNFPS